MINYPELFIRLVLAAFLGGILGLEREVRGRAAGIRTYLTISLGSALIMLISEYYTISYGLPPTWVMNNDQGRIAAQAVSGIGFLGAGVILRYKDHIRGLTTAACIWVACAIGLAIGGGLYVFGLLVTGLTVISLMVLKRFEKRLKKDWYKEVTVVSEDIPGQFNSIQKVIEKYDINISNFGYAKDLEKKEVTANFFLQGHDVSPYLSLNRQLMQEIVELSGVKRVDLV
jgi:putative Mg2+ transporter-C (MgtC) family protein